MMDSIAICPKTELKIKAIPKIELHAHLSGSLSDETVLNLLQKRNASKSNMITPDMQFTIGQGSKRTFSECFEIFKIIHILTDNLETVKTISNDVIKEFHEDKVFYLELRTTPKHVEGVYTKKDYLKTVLDSIINAEKTMSIVVRLLISIDRARGIDDAWSTLNLTKEFLNHKDYAKYICGVDVSGNPNSGSLIDYVPILQEARTSGLKLSVHLLEVNSKIAFEEAEKVIALGLVDRIGHATYLHPYSGGWEKLSNLVKNKKIPIEICLSSNWKCGSVKTLKDHHVKHWIKDSHPVAICTDDKGVFSTSMSEELAIFLKVIDGNITDVQNIITTSVEASFLNDDDKETLKCKIIKNF